MLPGVVKTEGMNGIKKEEIRNEESLEERLKDFEGEKLEDAPVVKTDWEHLMNKYFGYTGRAFTLCRFKTKFTTDLPQKIGLWLLPQTLFLW